MRTDSRTWINWRAEARYVESLSTRSLTRQAGKDCLERRFLATRICLILFHSKDGKFTATPGNGYPVATVRKSDRIHLCNRIAAQ